MTIRCRIAIIAGKCTALLLRLVRSGGEALPGLVAEKICPTILQELAGSCQERIVITGTNGKTTTTRLIAQCLATNHQPAIHNRSGSNLIRGHIVAFLRQTSWTGQVHAKIALLEADEAVIPRLIKEVKPSILVLHNLFRDQLDRFGEVDATVSKWREALAHFPATGHCFCNADDANLTHLVQILNPNQVTFYGLHDSTHLTPTPSSPGDAYLSPVSHLPLAYSGYYMAHLGIYHDPKSSFRRPTPQYRAEKIVLDRDSSTFSLQHADTSLTVTVPQPGLYNVYNAVAAYAVACKLSISPSAIQSALSQKGGAFGRFERINYQGKEYILCLIKNPVGASEVVRTIVHNERSPIALACYVNDNFADGIDTSWYWDTNYEPIIPHLSQLVCSGTRASDMALRLKYAGLSQNPVVISNLRKSFEHLLNHSESRWYILTTYTAALELQKILATKKIKPPYWHE